MSDLIDFAALKAQLEQHAQSARQIPSEPLFSIRPDVLRAIIAMAEERDAAKMPAGVAMFHAPDIEAGP